MDGGTDHDVNLISAIQSCLEVVDDTSKIILDIAICQSAPQTGETIDKSAFHQFMDGRHIRKAQNGMNVINWQTRAYPDVNFRYLFYQEVGVSYLELIQFNNSTTWPVQVEGRE